MGFVEAIRSAFITKYATFSGRACRSEFWWFRLANLIAYYIATQTSKAFILHFTSSSSFTGSQNRIALSIIIAFIIEIILFTPFLAAASRRLHDRNISSIWASPFIITMLIPYFLIFLVINRIIYNDDMYILLGLNIILQLLLHIPFLFKGTDGLNQYGPNPLSKDVDTDVFS
ncbi:DUF805 domain-containing protein [Bartonella sp. HY406]|uniref:DUF805 domain-containing protein n=1 Tax=Bartonella sp. HY406 TaxID=2979331 RepID=UPI0021C8A931|nr:DUF805 domain-containing protein [Bartonella sp. HY406]UXN04115.1 DUF805 domain-containing protein [Bartonella sp. HY406]